MASKRKPINQLKFRTKKIKITNSQKFTIETIFDRFPNLKDDIVKHLDDKSLANCVEVNRKWQTTIENQRVYLIAKIQKWSTNSIRFRKEWSMAFVKIPLELLRRLAEYIMGYQYFECEYFLNPIRAESLWCKLHNITTLTPALYRLVHFAGDTLWQGEDDKKLVTLIRRNREVQV